MSDTCSKHSFETAAGVCRQCHNPYCADCLVFAFGPDKPPYCVACALKAGGVRHHGAKMNPRLRRSGILRRKVLVDVEPVPELGFDDVQIELPDRVNEPVPVRRTTRKDIDPEVLAMVEEAEEQARQADDADEAAPVSPRRAEPDADSLADWAASLDARPSVTERALRARNRDPRPERVEALSPWPTTATGTPF